MIQQFGHFYTPSTIPFLLNFIWSDLKSDDDDIKWNLEWNLTDNVKIRDHLESITPEVDRK